MTTIAFDTLKLAERLERGGFTTEQARTQAEALAEVFSDDRNSLATKLDLADVKIEIEKVRADLIKWVVTVGILQTAIISALVLQLAM